MSILSIRLRRSEILLCTFFLYVSTVALFRPVEQEIVLRTLSTNTAVVLGLFILSTRSDGILAHVRDWLPVGLILLAYREMGWLALPHANQDFENYWIHLDRWLLDHGFRAAVESLGPLLPNILELSYLLTYLMPPLTVAALYFCHKRERMDDALLILLAGTLAAYACYPWFPSDTPRRVFAGLDLPLENAVRRFNLLILGGYGIRTSVFPSGHAAASFAAALAVTRVLPDRKWWGRGLMLLAVLIALATVYGRYHFAIDTIAGLALAVAAWGWSFTWKSLSK